MTILVIKGHRLKEICKSKSGALTCLQTELKVVFSDNENDHSFDKKKEGKCNTEGALAPFLELEVVGSEGKKNFTAGKQKSRKYTQMKFQY